MTAQIIGHSLTDTQTSPQFALGTEMEFGGTIYRYILAAAAIAAGDSLVIDTGNANEPNALLPSSAVNQPIAAVAHIAIASGSYGWVTRRGKVASAKVAAGTAAGAQLGSSATAGTLSTITIGAAFVQAEIQRALAAAVGVGLQAMDAEAGGLAEIFVHG
jgi:hypothetical protein